jgi:8-oxo-dGTP pyrophosphatase MutT (NUDIX family)
MSESANPARPAATVILMRDRRQGAPELLMIERHGGMEFAAGAMVFPGGAVDEEDWALAERIDASRFDLDDRAARIAVVRETIEEAGIVIGLAPTPDPADVAEMRRLLIEGKSLSVLIDAFGLELDLQPLVAFARWLPPENTHGRRYDTRFYVATVPPDTIGEVDWHEGVSLIWASAAEVLRGHEDGQHRVIFPTFCNLRRLSRYSSFEDAKADAVRHAIDIITPRTELHDEVKWLVVPEGLGYPRTAVRASEAFRG